MNQLEALKRWAEAEKTATPGPWEGDKTPCDDHWACTFPGDVEFIAAARAVDPAAMLRLVEEVRAYTTTGNNFRKKIYSGNDTSEDVEEMYEAYSNLCAVLAPFLED